MTNTNRPLRVFLCHSSKDKPAVRELYKKLRVEGWIDPWLDEEKLLPGQDWHMEIEKAVEVTDVVMVLLSNQSVSQEGFVQRELKLALDISDEKPEGAIFIVPLRLDDCPAPRRLRGWQYVDYFPADRKDWAFDRVIASLKLRADTLGLKFEMPAPVVSQIDKPTYKAPAPQRKSKPVVEKPKSAQIAGRTASPTNENKLTLSNGMDFMRVPGGKFLMGSTKENKFADDDEQPRHTVNIPYDYWMARFPVTNEQYNLYIKTKSIKHPVDGWEKKKDHPVVSVSWEDVLAYCQWLNDLLKSELSSGLFLRLPTEAEWEKAARGEKGNEWPWGDEFDKNKCNSNVGGKGGTTPVDSYSQRGDSPYGCADMAGNVWEWTHSLMKEYPYKANDGREDKNAGVVRVLRGGAFIYDARLVRCAARFRGYPNLGGSNIGFRVTAAPILS